ncbi:MAG TPA: hypothetical protein VK730_11230 [Solirubrobacteraceae bacterium]|jgi:hypothetical protein|nr:hypothetical protein [Solirubrobacteraceae bacterium]
MKGTVSGLNTVSKVVVEWSECGGGCHSEGATKVLKSEPLKGSLQYINKTSKTVGLVLEKEEQNIFEKSGSIRPLWANYTCGAGGALRGHLIGVATPINSYKTTFALGYKAGGSGKTIQEPSQYEGGPTEDQLFSPVGSEWSPFALVAADTLTFEEEARIEA